MAKNLTKKEAAKLAQEMSNVTKQKADVERQKTLVRLAWQFIEKDLTIYDAQTVVNAVGGFMKFELQRKVEDIKVSDLIIDVSNEKDGSVKTAMVHILEVFKDEKANDASQLLERLGKILGTFSAHQYMKNKMDTVKVEEIVA